MGRTAEVSYLSALLASRQPDSDAEHVVSILDDAANRSACASTSSLPPSPVLPLRVSSCAYISRCHPLAGCVRRDRPLSLCRSLIFPFVSFPSRSLLSSLEGKSPSEEYFLKLSADFVLQLAYLYLQYGPADAPLTGDAAAPVLLKATVRGCVAPARCSVRSI